MQTNFEPSPEASPKRVLLAEDSRLNQLFAARMLERLGLKVQVVGSGRQALEALSTESYDIVLMDCQMPEVDGFEATRRFRELEGEIRAHVPIIALTATDSVEARQQCTAAGMDGFLQKPVTQDGLARAIAEMLGE